MTFAYRCFIGVVALILSGVLCDAAEMYDLDFTDPDVGSVIRVFGNPEVQSSVGPFTDALVFDAVAGYEQIQLDIGTVGPRLEIQYDMLVHNLLNSQYSFALLLDSTSVYRFDLHGGLNAMYASQSPPFVDATVGSFANDQVYHFAVSVDLLASTWSVAVDGAEKWAASMSGTNLYSIRFSMAPWVVGAGDAPGRYAAIDNVRISVVPEPSTFSLLLALGIPSFLACKFRKRTMRKP